MATTKPDKEEQRAAHAAEEAADAELTALADVSEQTTGAVPPVMSETIPGGAYIVNRRWVNADGVPLKPDQIAAARAKQKEREDAAKSMDKEIANQAKAAREARGIF